MNKIKFFLAAVAMFAFTNLAAQTPAEVNAKYNEAVELINAKDYAAAIPVLEQVVDMGIDAGADAAETVSAAQKLIPTCYFQYGLALCRENRFEEAIPQLDNALMYAELYQDTRILNNTRKLMSQAYVAMGATAYNNQDYTKAIEIFGAGYEKLPADTDLGLYLAESYAENKDYAKALEVYSDIIALEERHTRYAEPAAKAREKVVYYQTLRASEAAQAGQTQQAYDIIEELLAIDPTSPEGHMLRIQTAASKQDWAKVIQWGDAAAEAQVDDAMKSNAYFMLGAAYQNTEQKDKAIATYRKVTAGPNAAKAREQIGVLGA